MVSRCILLQYLIWDMPDSSSWPNLVMTCQSGLDAVVFDHRCPDAVCSFLRLAATWVSISVHWLNIAMDSHSLTVKRLCILQSEPSEPVVATKVVNNSILRVIHSLFEGPVRRSLTH